MSFELYLICNFFNILSSKMLGRKPHLLANDGRDCVICKSNFRDIYRYLHTKKWVFIILLLSYHIFLTLLIIKIKNIYEYLLFQII